MAKKIYSGECVLLETTGFETFDLLAYLRFLFPLVFSSSSLLFSSFFSSRRNCLPILLQSNTNIFIFSNVFWSLQVLVQGSVLFGGHAQKTTTTKTQRMQQSQTYGSWEWFLMMGLPTSAIFLCHSCASPQSVQQDSHHNHKCHTSGSFSVAGQPASKKPLLFGSQSTAVIAAEDGHVETSEVPHPILTPPPRPPLKPPCY